MVRIEIPNESLEQPRKIDFIPEEFSRSVIARALGWAEIKACDERGEPDLPTPLQLIEEKFISNKSSYSAILYGPPGTSKSTIAEGIAQKLEYPLVGLTPSDFVADGSDAVARRVKLVFDFLIKLKDVVVFFDEIDRLVLDMDSKEYRNQQDIFQFITPSMLTKLSDLRKRKQLIFLIGTNYVERIHTPIKRRGRIDELLLILPYNLKSRIKILSNLLADKELKVEGDKVDLWAKSTPLYVYQELKTLVDEIERLSKTDELDVAFDKALASLSPLISLGSYSRRFEAATKRQTTGEPIEEFIQLGCLLMEADADPTRLTSFCDIVSRNLGHWLDEDAPDLGDLSKNDWTLNQLKRSSDKDVGKLYDALLERRPHS